MRFGQAVVCAGFLLSAVAIAAPGELWSSRRIVPDDVAAAAHSQAALYSVVHVDPAQIRHRLNAIDGAANGANAVQPAIELPMPDGSTQRFTLFEVPVMEPELTAQFPDFKAYAGQSLDCPGATARLTFTARGFHAMILSPEGDVFINPAAAQPTDRSEYYVSFRQQDAMEHGSLFCDLLPGDGEPSGDPSIEASTELRGSSLSTASLIFLPTAEWAILHGGTTASVLSALVEHASRISAIYERELCVRFVLAARQPNMFQFDPVNDGLTNSNTTSLYNEAAGIFTRLGGVGTANLRQVIGTYGGGVASIGSSCTGNASVANSGLSIDHPYTTMVAAHELGHMYGANHVFSGTGERCVGNGANNLEPGGGSSIMSYAQQCYPDNIVSRSELMFHSYSLQEMRSRAVCGTQTPTGNTRPSIEIVAGLNFNIPMRTPIRVPIEFSDPNGDSVTVSWDQSNTSGLRSLAQGDVGSNSIIRAIMPNSESERVIPRWEYLLAGIASPGETLPTTNRSITLNMVARDNRPGGGATSMQSIQLQSRTTPVPFTVTSPADGRSHSTGPLLVTWNTAGTQSGLFSLANVRISLMRSDADRNPLVLSNSTPNDGSEIVQLPDDLDLPAARVLVQPINGAFFNISPKPFAVLPRSGDVRLEIAAAPRTQDNFGNDNNNTYVEPRESYIRVYFPIVNAGFSPSAEPFGELRSLTPTATVSVAAAAWPMLDSAQIAENTTPFVVAVSSDHLCGDPINLELTLNALGFGPVVFPAQMTVGRFGRVSTPQVYSYTGPATVIPDGDPNGVTVNLNVPSLPGKLIDVDFSFDGSASTDMNSTLVGLNHPYVGDLVIELTNPSGTTIKLADRPGDIGNFGHNFATTLFDMDQIGSYIQDAIPRRAPHDGVFLPAENLDLLIDSNPIGVWKLRVADMSAGQQNEATPTVAAAIRRFSLRLTCELPVLCVEPITTYCPGDFSKNGVVNDQDFEVFVVAYNKLIDPAGDMNGDTITDDADFTLFAQAYDALVCP